MAKSQTNKARLTAAERRRKAVALRKAGATLQQIGDELGVTFQAVSKMLKRELKILADATQGEAEEMRQLELERLDTMLLGLWPRARQGHEGAVDRVIKIMQRRAKLLGLDAPEKLEATGKDGGPIETKSRVVVYIPDNGRGGDEE